MDSFEGSMINRPDDWAHMKTIIVSGGWVTDEIIWGYGQFQEELANEFDPGSTRIMNPFFLFVLLENKDEFRQLCERRAKTFLLEGNLTSIYFPTNVHQTHWILYRLKIKYHNHTAYPTFIYYDPLVNNVTPRDLEIAELRLKILFENMPLGGGIISRAPLKGRRSVYDDLQQDDGASCGYYVLECINRMALGSPRTEFDVPAFREEVEDVLDYKIQRANKQIKDETRKRMEEITNYYRAMHRLSGANSVLSE